MKTASAATLAILNATGEVKILRADFYTITPRNGSVLRYTDADKTLVVAGNTFVSGPILQRSKTKQTVGVSVDSMQVTLVDSGNTLIEGKPIIQQFRAGYFKGAQCKVEKGFFLSFDDTSPGLVHHFEGEVSEPACDHMSVSFLVKSAMAELNKQMPEDVYQGTCGNQLFDTVCGAVEASFTYTGTAGIVVNRSRFQLSGVVQPDTFFALGKAKFNTGANAGQPPRTIKIHAAGYIEVFQPFPYDVAPGDSLTVIAGCDKLPDTCHNKFNRRDPGGLQAEPYIPVPETAMEGGGVSGTAATAGRQGGVAGMIGSAVTAGKGAGTYQS